MFNLVFSHVGITDVLDVIATSVLIYYLLLLIRGTRAVQILMGILVLVALLGIANVLHLQLLVTILQLIVVGAAVTVPIVFQPELRRALEQIGRGGLFRLDSDDRVVGWTRPEDRGIDALAQAAFLLARDKRGALVVIEQQSGLKEFCETGTELDARLSAELLLAIFMPRSPLHDGAAIVRENLIVAAGCFLPLAEHSLRGVRVGTRHRAAIGLTEQTDAVVLIVSEETGAVSIARNGKLSRPIDEEQRLVKMLLAITRAPRRERRLRNDLVSHLRARLTSEKPRADHPQELHT
ncbi:MAG TPA: diadenylate cyclase CdaA [Candidatus Tumulicola sp.]|jgi:diadenylate cyclase